MWTKFIHIYTLHTQKKMSKHLKPGMHFEFIKSIENVLVPNIIETT